MKHLLRTLLVLAPVALSAQTIVGSKHDLTTLYGNVNGQVCIFCHTPHQAAGSTSGPLWNHTASTAVTYTTYTNVAGTTMGQPGAQSKACLSCHDGTVGVGSIINNGGRGAATLTGSPAGFDAQGRMIAPNVNLVGTDLSNDHPVAVTYPTSNAGYKSTTLHTTVKLYAGSVECASCHAVHDPTNVPFLRRNNTSSALCTECHSK
jgi:predicted CXXCH cytochrome family protein